MHFKRALVFLFFVASSLSACRAGFVSLEGTTVKGQTADGGADSIGEKPAPAKDSPLCINMANLDEEESKLVFVDENACPAKGVKETPNTDNDTPAKDPPAKDPPANDPPAKDPPAKDPPAKDPPKTDDPTQASQSTDEETY